MTSDKKTVSKQRCWVLGCVLDEGSTFHRLPKNNPQLLKELGFADNFEVKPSARVCRRHFTDDSFIEIGGKLRFSSNIKVLGSETQESDEADECIGCFAEFKQRLSAKLKLFSDQDWRFTVHNDKVFIHLLELNEICGVRCKKNIIVNSRKAVTCYFGDMKLKIDERIPRIAAFPTLVKWTDMRILIEALEKHVIVYKEKDIRNEKMDRLVSIKTDTIDHPLRTDNTDLPLTPSQETEASSDDDFEWPEDPDEDWIFQEESQTSSLRKPRPEDYTCVFCQKFCVRISDKIKHMKADHADELHCPVCKKKWVSVMGTERCMKGHTFGYDFLCQICGRPFRFNNQLSKHIDEAHSSQPEKFACDLCGTQIKRKVLIRRHMLAKHLKRRLLCPHDTCSDRSYTTQYALNIHLYKHHNVPAPVRCRACGDGFTCASELRVHLRRTCNDGVNRRLKSGINLQAHRDEVNGKFQCNLCPKAFPTKKHFADHFQGYHRDNKTCAICEKTFTSFMGYRKHYKVVHKKILKFHCEHPGCGKNFSTKGILISHRNTHTGEKPFACNLCSFRTGDLPTLSKHRKKMHTE